MDNAPGSKEPPGRVRGVALTVLMCAALASGLLGFSTLPALLPVLMTEWAISGTEAGWVASLIFAGYMVAVPILVPMTDRVDARTVFLAGAAVSSLSLVGFGMFAGGFWSGLFFRVTLGIGFAGTYMPGLKVLTDRLETENPSRGIAFYTSSYLIGAALSYYLAGRIDATLGWRWAFALMALGPLVSVLLVWWGTSPKPPPPGVPFRLLPDFRPLLKNRQALGYMGAYAMHSWELFASGSWVIAFLTFSAGLRSGAAAGWNITAIGSLITLTALPASILGNELALRIGRRRTVTIIMWVSAALGCSIGFMAAQPFPIVVALCVAYGLTTTAESATVTAGAVMSATPETRGALMALHSFIGFGGGFLGPVAFGLALDMAGGRETGAGWQSAYIVAGAGAALGPLFLWWLGGKDTGKAPQKQ
ncbi:MAG: MFS transporter [bacterium]